MTIKKKFWNSMIPRCEMVYRHIVKHFEKSESVPTLKDVIEIEVEKIYKDERLFRHIYKLGQACMEGILSTSLKLVLFRYTVSVSCVFFVLPNNFFHRICKLVV